MHQIQLMSRRKWRIYKNDKYVIDYGSFNILNVNENYN